MKRMQSLMAGVLGAGAVTVGASAQFNREFTAWGDNTHGQCSIPSDVLLTSIAGGSLHSLGVTADGRVRAWGTNFTGQCDVPVPLNDVVQVAAGGWYLPFDQRGHSAALLRDGTVRAWGSNEYGQCDVPPQLSGVTKIGCGWAHSVALLTDGRVDVWGAGLANGADPDWGQRVVPADMGAVSDISTRGCHIMAQLVDGTVRCWGRNAEQQCNVPAKLGGVRQIAAGSDHSIALLPSGEVRCWGWDYHRQCSVPSDLGVARGIAASLYGTIALLDDGRVVTWGLIDPAPANLPAADHIIAGGYHAMSMTQRDCNADGIGDSLALATARDFDGDGDGLPDSCDQPDASPVLHEILITRGNAGPFPWPICAAWDTRTEANTHLWDMWVSRESANGPWVNQVGVPAGNPFRLAVALKDGTTVLRCRFNPNACLDAFFSVNLWLDASPQPSISATNQKPVGPFTGQIPGLVPGESIQAAGVVAARVGSRQIQVTDFSVSPADDAVGAVAYGVDGSNDLVATLTILVSPACGGDVSRNGFVDGVDLAAVLGAWGTDGHGQFECDVDGDGIVSGSDLAQVLGSWGPCP
ncbi:MAG: dockerin type I domain-containing protein [Phycisphaerales bacterium]